ncbi:hypothetical protein [Lysinibacillus sp. Bpr_S20]|uniref:hypothetical protein n=1 Tax=Lysinibacillus sp. Bpr_S20 TaxID=2933964 RepID=UPI0020139867|nr:hypothetical protein [Lysinibacillus sp. Bpr_S20]MCL1702203.1 hypothetical protein [Lysinibacillus sp. Bpr_S20]
MGSFLTEIKQKRTIEELVEYIKSVYENDTSSYLPALISEGSFIGTEESDFYLKVVLKHKALDINKTWLKGNLQFYLNQDEDIYNSLDLYKIFVHNLIVYRNFKETSVYEINPNLTSNENYSELGVKDLKYVDAIYISGMQQNEVQNVIQYEKKGSDEYLKVSKKFLADYVVHEDSEWTTVYELVIEFEYRNKTNTFEQLDYQNNESAFIDVSTSSGDIMILGSIKVPFIKENRKERAIKVIDLNNHILRNHNPKNYNGDTDEGFVVFSKEAYEALMESYYFYGIEIIDRQDITKSILVDYFPDKIVFFEAEYNKLPDKIKDKIDIYNQKVLYDLNDIISKAMFEMQLNASWGWEKYLEPDKLLASLFRERYFNISTDRNLSFTYPNDLVEFGEFINMIEEISKIRLDRFNQQSAEVIALTKIRDKAYIDELTNASIINLYLKYCYAVNKELREE